MISFLRKYRLAMKTQKLRHPLHLKKKLVVASYSVLLPQNQQRNLVGACDKQKG